ncbi:hypothetical protein J2S74_001001 [Evansella vedderi]|uniref:Uncharacterized protein n=1 Tax=Evansella vedderi TaxID=38282 RepID=A0ABT9ZRZ1_9BACI|nr:hypothetical protein [Evansella vedderi]MDQ0253629.1 hypothetical protein [Evansella vedderi]
MEEILSVHNIKVTNENNNAFQLIVHGEEFFPQRIQVQLPGEQSFSMIRRKEINRFYLGQELLDLAMMSAYYLNIPAFTSHIQRRGKEISVISVHHSSTPSPYIGDNNPYKNTQKLLGADLEVMARKRINGSFVAIPVSDVSQEQIGVDRALLRKGNKFFQPIIELRARPQETGLKLQREFLRLKKALENRAVKNQLNIVAEENPKGRFLLGGHIHISNERPSYRKVALLDALIALPFSCKYEHTNPSRRQSFGRLGAVRINSFNGFEYRTLPTWYKFIDDGETFFRWLEIVFLNEKIPFVTIPPEAIRAYYSEEKKVLQREVIKIFSGIQEFLTHKEKEVMKNWLRWLDIPYTID